MIILIILVATGYMAQAASIQQMEERNWFTDLFKSHHCSKIGEYCKKSRDCCGHVSSGTEGPAPRCDYNNRRCVVRQK